MTTKTFVSVLATALLLGCGLENIKTGGAVAVHRVGPVPYVHVPAEAGLLLLDSDV